MRPQASALWEPRTGAEQRAGNTRHRQPLGATNTYVTLQFSAGLEGEKKNYNITLRSVLVLFLRDPPPNLSKNGVYDNVSFLICSLLFYSQGDGL